MRPFPPILHPLVLFREFISFLIYDVRFLSISDRFRLAKEKILYCLYFGWPIVKLRLICWFYRQQQHHSFRIENQYHFPFTICAYEHTMYVLNWVDEEKNVRTHKDIWPFTMENLILYYIGDGDVAVCHWPANLSYPRFFFYKLKPINPLWSEIISDQSVVCAVLGVAK